jgi:FtsP/CotA-like multicopper oxidase with cupredoxin domain
MLSAVPRLLRWLLGLVVVIALVVAGAIGFFVFSYFDAEVDTIGEVEFERELAIPPLAKSAIDAKGRRVFDLTMQTGETEFGRERPTPTWGVNGSYLGPTLRAKRGEQVVVNVTNDLPESSTMHWHGMHLPAVMDGGPHQLIDRGEAWSPTWRIDQPAATLWYHPHPHGRTAEHVYRGVAGMWIIDDPDAEAAAALPHEYGVDDIPVIVQDKKFDGSSLDTSRGIFHSTGLLGDTVLVNGTPGPFLDVTTERVRLRLLNASNARIYNFAFADNREFQQVASDGGLLPRPVTSSRLELSPGERAEIVVTMEPGETTVLNSRPLESVDDRYAGTDDSLAIMELRAAAALRTSEPVPAELAPAPGLSRDDVVATRDFVLRGTSINGRDMDMDRIDATVEVDTTELWRVRNEDGIHNFHVHDVQFAVAAIDGRPPPPELAGWKDTIFVPQDREFELLVRFTDYTDPDTPYMFHCHLLRHEDSGMMGQFVVVGRGTESTSPTLPSDDHDHDTH